MKLNFYIAKLSLVLPTFFVVTAQANQDGFLQSNQPSSQTVRATKKKWVPIINSGGGQLNVQENGPQTTGTPPVLTGHELSYEGSQTGSPVLTGHELSNEVPQTGGAEPNPLIFKVPRKKALAPKPWCPETEVRICDNGHLAQSSPGGRCGGICPEDNRLSNPPEVPGFPEEPSPPTGSDGLQ